MTNAADERSIVQRAIDFAFGKPEAHNPVPRMNRKMRRTQRALLRKSTRAARIQKHRENRP